MNMDSVPLEIGAGRAPVNQLGSRIKKSVQVLQGKPTQGGSGTLPPPPQPPKGNDNKGGNK